ncbi:hypothetical protein [Haladaptatus sp. NG-WS-4]
MFVDERCLSERSNKSHDSLDGRFTTGSEDVENTNEMEVKTGVSRLR